VSDLIEREDAIKALRLEYPMMPLFKELREEWAIKTEGFRKAEEVIMKLPSVDTPTTMTGVIDAIREAEYRGYMKAVEDRPKGEWIEVEWYPIAVPSKWCENDEKPIYASKLQCSKCGFTRNFLDGHTAQYNFCPQCGADMRGERADEHGRNKSADRQ